MSNLQDRMLGPRHSIVARGRILAVFALGLIACAIVAMGVVTPDILIAWTNPV